MFCIIFIAAIIIGCFIGIIVAAIKSSQIALTDHNIVKVTLVDKSGKYNTFDVEYSNGKIKTETVSAGSSRYKTLFKLSRENSEQ